MVKQCEKNFQVITRFSDKNPLEQNLIEKQNLKGFFQRILKLKKVNHYSEKRLSKSEKIGNS